MTPHLWNLPGPSPMSCLPYTKLHKVLDTPMADGDRELVRETNRHALEIPEGKKKTRGGEGGKSQWTPLEFGELKAYLGICLLMGVKRNLNLRYY